MSAKSHVSLVVFCVAGMLSLYSRVTCAAEYTMTLVSAGGKVDVTVDVWTAPERWDSLSLPEQRGDVQTGRLVVFSGERYFWFRGNVTAPMDVLYLNTGRQVIGILENVTESSLRGICEPALAVLLLPGGFVARHQLAGGNLLVSEAFPLLVQTETTDKQRQAQLKVMLQKLSRAANVNAAAANDLGACYLSHRMFSQARLLYQRRSRLESGSPASKVGIALAAAGEGQLDEAMQLLLDVIASDSAYVDAYLHLARIFQRLNKGDAVAATLASGVSKHPELLALRLELARLYIRNGIPAQGVALLESAPKGSLADAATVSRVMGDAYLRQGDAAKAAAAYLHYLDVFPYAPHGAELRLFIARHRRNAHESDGAQ
ncbi:MAG: hypothetical protein JXX14_07415 [Deltaproteobacteria bacterium]|nr:hypothetical protein [Deltaproteobacteria bacterium]